MKLPPLPPALAQRATALAVAVALAATTPSLPALAVDASTLNEAELKAMSARNVKLPPGNGAAERAFASGVELAAKAQDADTQTRDVAMLRRAEEKLSLLVDDLAPEYVGGYTNRANVRVALGDLDAAVADYNRAYELAPLAPDAWIVLLNRGSTLLAQGRTDLALADMQAAVRLGKSDKIALLGRGSVYHAMRNWEAAAADYGAVCSKEGMDVQPFWLRYSLELFQLGRQKDALGIARRVATKFDLEPEVQVAVGALQLAGGTDQDRTLALQQWRGVPASVKQRAVEFDLKGREWPPAALDAAAAFLTAVAPEGTSGPDVPFSRL